jgi:muramoyltetrapeptide carboxypeptidase
MIHPCQTPLPLKSGDLLRVIAPSGRLRERIALDRGIEIWRNQGYQVEVAPAVTDGWGYLAGTDLARRAQLAVAQFCALEAVMGECDCWKIGNGVQQLHQNG